jgi:hypothetical protein
MTWNAALAARAPSGRRFRFDNLDVLLACMAALPFGLALDGRLGLLPALNARCGGSGSLMAALEWHWACMPATCLMMLFVAPVWIGLKALARAGQGDARVACGTRPIAAVGCHVAMLAGMVFALGAGPNLAGLAGAAWTSGAAIAAMAFGMISGLAAASLGRRA